MVKEHGLIMMVESMLGNSRMGKGLVKEHTLGLMDKCYSRIEDLSLSQILVKQTDWCYILGYPKTKQLGNQME